MVHVPRGKFATVVNVEAVVSRGNAFSSNLRKQLVNVECVKPTVIVEVVVLDANFQIGNR
jgi:hypothetical protein